MTAPSDRILDPYGHRPHGPRFGLGPYETGDIRPQDIYQPPKTEDIPKIKAQVAAAVESGTIGLLHIDDYQAWCELNWKEPHGTLKSQERFRKKLVEEFSELNDELERVENGEKGIEPSIESELGDVIWTVTAISSNLGRKVKTALMERLHLYGKGTRYVDGDVPHWVEVAQKLSYKEDDFSISSVEDLIEAGYTPQPSPFMYIDDDSHAGWAEIDQAKTLLHHSLRTIDYIAEKAYEPNTYHAGSINNDDAEAADNLIAEVYLNCAYLAKHMANSSLSDIVRQNIVKVTNRVATKTVDKSDNPR